MKDGPLVDIVIKIGGGLLAHPAHFDAALETLADAASSRRFLIVPGGGPFADAVRHVDGQLKLSDAAAHWMAVLAMDQYAHLLASRLRSAELVAGPPDIAAALGRARLPVLAPSRWLRDVDPLPHSWDVTSDSIAAWVAGMVGAQRLVLVKPPGAGDAGIDPYFHRAIPAGFPSPLIIPADQIDALRRSLTV
jgi:5-(aminomethyl)-3-furanmethanol phosphate kinase